MTIDSTKGGATVSPHDLSGAVWKKSSHSGGTGECVELARVGDVGAIRDSKSPAGAVLAFGQAELASFLSAAKAGLFDS